MQKNSTLMTLIFAEKSADVAFISVIRVPFRGARGVCTIIAADLRPIVGVW